MEKVCLYCGKTFKARSNSRKYCSRECGHADSSRKGCVTLICKECNKEFTKTKASKKQFCSRGMCK